MNVQKYQSMLLGSGTNNSINLHIDGTNRIIIEIHQIVRCTPGL